MEQIFGYIENIVFMSEEKGFTVARLKEPKKKELTTIVGCMPSLQPGETLQCKGVWKRHAQHGLQFEVREFETKTPVDLVGIQKYLESGMIKGIGPVYAERIVKKYGLKTLEVIENDPNTLLDVEGLGKKRVGQIAQCWKDQRQIREVMIFLRSHQISPALAQKIFRAYGVEAIEKVKENPYGLARDIFGIGFKTADTIGMALGIAANSPLRLKAGITHILWQTSNDGHVCFPEEKLIELCIPLLQVTKEELQSCVDALIEEKEIIRENQRLWVRPLFLAEQGIVRELKGLYQGMSLIASIHTEKAVEWVEKNLELQLAEEQRLAVALSTQKKILIVTGGPGTGKSTITKAILAIFSKRTKKIQLAAPTGRAAKRMSSITGYPATTIHSMLEMDFKNGGFKKNKENPLNCDLLIIDESSMLDTQLMYHLLKAIPTTCVLILIGDVDQLPSVGPGSVLKDLIASACFPVVQLNKIFRQSAGSKIILNAHAINRGEMPDLTSQAHGDFFFLYEEEPEKALQCILNLVAKRLPKAFRLHRFLDIQILSPMKKGIIGIENLNHALQATLNPSPHPFIYMGKQFHVGDKVMQIRNNYDKEVFNGDVGRIIEIDLTEKALVVAFEEKRIAYEFAELDELTLAYAVSVHKYQGSECPCVIIPVHTTHFKMLQRNLLYTAVTRGKRLVVLVGTTKALSIAVKNDEVQQRYTGLKDLLSQTSNTK